MLVTLKIKIEIWNIMLSGINFFYFFFLKQSAVEDIRSVPLLYPQTYPSSRENSVCKSSPSILIPA